MQPTGVHIPPTIEFTITETDYRTAHHPLFIVFASNGLALTRPCRFNQAITYVMVWSWKEQLD